MYLVKWLNKQPKQLIYYYLIIYYYTDKLNTVI